MIDYDDVRRQIEDLHLEAEETADLARATTDPVRRSELLTDAKRMLRKAARLRGQMEAGL